METLVFLYVCETGKTSQVGERLPSCSPCHVQSHDPKLDYLGSDLSSDVKTHILLLLKPPCRAIGEFSEEQGDQIKDESFTVNRTKQQNSLYFPFTNSKSLFLPLQRYFFQPDKVRGLKQTGAHHGACIRSESEYIVHAFPDYSAALTHNLTTLNY